ncbi:MAG: TrmH family RNA methyltransferase [Acidimicrobiia bacterium]|nr:TrmH family RNA methyltransferase [Acidimicrobiia bacterium]
MTRSLGPTELKRLHRSWRRRTSGRVALLLDGVQNPFNIGAIARSAAAYGVQRAWLVGGDSSLRSPKVQKTALGTERYVAWERADELGGALAAARADGYRLVGLELAAGAQPLFEADLAGDVCLVIGHEERGLSAAGAQACEALVYLPLVGRVGSLNVATATSMALYECRRQEWSAEPPPPATGRS